MSILERLNTLEKRVGYYEDLISRIDNTSNEPFKYSRKITTPVSKEILELKEIIGIPKTDKNTRINPGAWIK